MNGKRRMTASSVFVSCLIAFFALPQSVLSADDHDHHNHHGHEMEVGISAAYIHLDAENESASGLHLHLMRRLKGGEFLQHFAVGLGLEGVFADHKHYSAMGSIGVFPWRNLVVTLSPGVAFADHEGEWETNYITHIEASYGFMVGEYEVGPVMGYAKSAEDRHYSVGIHLGKGF